MTEHTRYEVATVADLRKVPREKLGALFVDLAEWVRITSAALELGPIATAVDEPDLSTFDRFVWIDDGEHIASVGVRVDGVEVVRDSWDCSEPRQ